MADHKALNRKQGAAFLDLGVRPGATLDVETFTIAPDRGAAEGFGRELAERGWRVAIAPPQPEQLARGDATWLVQADRRFPQVRLEQLDAMCEDLEAVAERHGCEFDGWCAPLPSPDALGPPQPGSAHPAAEALESPAIEPAQPARSRRRWAWWRP